MIKELVCIACPNGCALKINTETLEVSGNKCKRGIDFAKEELLAPQRCVSSLVKTTLKEYPVVSVRTSKEIPKDKIFALMELLDKIVIKEYLDSGSIVLANVFGSDVNVITTTKMSQGGK